MKGQPLFRSRLFAVAFGLVALPALAQEGSVTVGGQSGTGLKDGRLHPYEAVPRGIVLFDARYLWKGASDFFLAFEGTQLGQEDQAATLVWGQTGQWRLKVSLDQVPRWARDGARTPYRENFPGAFSLPDGMQLALQNVFNPFVAPAGSVNTGTSSNAVTGIGAVVNAANPTQANFHALAPWLDGAQPVELRTVRKTGRASFTYSALEDFEFSLAYQREQRSGREPLGLPLSTNPYLEVAAPVEYRTHDLRLEGEYARDLLFAHASVSFSKFENEVASVSVENPYRLQMVNPTPGTLVPPSGWPAQGTVLTDVNLGRIPLAPDNDAFAVDLAGGLQLPLRHKLTLNASFGQSSMETSLLPLSTNALIRPSSNWLATNGTTQPYDRFSVRPPYDSVRVRYDTTVLGAKLTGDPMRLLGYSLGFRSFELKDATDRYAFPSHVRGDVGASVPVADAGGGSYVSAPYVRPREGYKKETLKAEAHTRPLQGLKLGLACIHDRKSYDEREVLDVKDLSWVASADVSHGRLSAHLAYTDQARRPGSRNPDAVAPSWDGASQLDLARRDSRILNGLLTLGLADELVLSLSAGSTRHRYPDAFTGRTEDRLQNWGLDLTWTPLEHLGLSAGYVRERMRFRITDAEFNRTAPPVANWRDLLDQEDNDPGTVSTYRQHLWYNRTDDDVDTLRGGLQLSLWPGVLELQSDLDYSLGRNRSAYRVEAGGRPEGDGWFPIGVTGVAPRQELAPPKVQNKLVVWKTRLDWHVDARLTLSLLHWLQTYGRADWATDLVQPYMGAVDPGANRWVFLGGAVLPYDARVVRLSLRYRF